MKTKKRSLEIIWYFFNEYKIHFIFLILMSIFIGILESLNVAILYPILSYGLGTSVSDNFFLNFIDNFVQIIPFDDDLIRYCFLFVIFAFIIAILKIFYFFFSVKLTSKIMITVKKNIFNKYINSDYQFFVDNKQGELLYKISIATNSINSILNIMSNIFVEVILSASIFMLLFSMSLKGSVLIIIGGIGYYYLTKYLSQKIHYIAGKKRLETGKQETVIVNEFTSGIKQIKVFKTFEYWKDIFDKTINTYWEYHRKGFFWKHIPEILLFMLIYISIGFTVIFIKLQNPSGFISTIPVIGTFAFAIFMIMPKLAKFGQYRMNLVYDFPHVETVYNLLKDKTYNKIKNGIKKFTILNSCIEFKNTRFTYKNRNILLDDVTLKIEKDKTTAIVGSSGSGKSTIANLILRLYDADNNSIFIDDVSIKEYDIFSFLEKIGYVSQDTFIYNASIKENITFGGNYTEEEIINASKLANANEFIQMFPDKYKTIVGDQGVMLSGGEKQRIAIARAMIRKPEILILDEATSSLDNISESIVQQAINKVSKNCTTFIIAHRLSTIQNADIIYVLDGCKIVEKGNHYELLEKKGKYWELYNIQK